VNAHPDNARAAALADARLTQAIASGDGHAFGALVRRYDALLHRTAQRILRNDADVDDAVQNAYLLAYRGIRNFRRDSKLSTWLVRIVINEALGCLRKRAQSAHVILMDDRDLDAAIESHADARSRHEGAPDELLMRSDVRRRIQACIDELPFSHRAVFVLRACEELSVREAAAALDIPEATVRTRFFRARRQLRRSLAGEKAEVAGRPLPLRRNHDPCRQPQAIAR
jgi:RNA polymerase sigma-70 factor (ECF subfamily)